MKNPPLVKITNYTMKYDFDCGPTSLAILLSAYNLEYEPDALIKILKTTEEDGTSWRRINRFLNSLGIFKVEQNESIKRAKEYLELQNPLFICWNVQEGREFISHYSLIVKIDDDKDKVIILDPEDHRKFTFHPLEEFKKGWAPYRYWSVRLIPDKKTSSKNLREAGQAGVFKNDSRAGEFNAAKVTNWISRVKKK